MGCSHQKLSETGLRIVGAFLKVKLCGCVRRSRHMATSTLDDNRIADSRPGIRGVPVAGPDTRVWQALSLPRNTSHQKGGWGNYEDLAGSGIVDIRAEIV